MLKNDLLAEVPPIRRAKGFRLYDQGGRRLIDLYQEGGGAILGHRSSTSILAAKNALSQGLAAGLPSVWEKRLTAAIRRMFPAYPAVRLFLSPERALSAIGLYLGDAVDPTEVLDPALSPAPESAPRVALWRPFLDDAGGGARVLLPVLPFTLCGAPVAVCLSGELPADFPPSDALPAFVLAGALRGLSALERSARADPFAGLPANRVVRLFDGSRGWTRRGPYVAAACAAGEYPALFRRFLGRGVLLSPLHAVPSILPGECSPGESTLLVDLFDGTTGG